MSPRSTPLRRNSESLNYATSRGNPSNTHHNESLALPNKLQPSLKIDSEKLQNLGKAMSEQMLIHEIGVETSDSNKLILNLLGG
jgi:hypothetical protein